MAPKNETAPSLESQFDFIVRNSTAMTLFTETEGGEITYTMTLRYMDRISDDWLDARESNPQLAALVATMVAKIKS